MHDFLSWTKLYLVHRFFNDLWSLKKTEKSPKTDAKKTGPFKDRKGEDRDRPKTGNCRTGTSLLGKFGNDFYDGFFSPFCY